MPESGSSFFFLGEPPARETLLIHTLARKIPLKPKAGLVHHRLTCPDKGLVGEEGQQVRGGGLGE